jgi:geranyl diphosphate 2-C-methyltransferase
MSADRKLAIAQLYDRKREDLNFILSKSDGLVHHHNGICDPNAYFSGNLSQEEILSLLHQQETNLANFGINYLSNIDSSMLGLDAGCGRGGSAILINRRLGCSIKGLSLSEYQIEFASELVKRIGVDQKVSFDLGDMCDTKFRGNSIDFVWACESTEHIDDLSKMFNEFFRITKPDSRLVIIAWCKGTIKSTEDIIGKVNQAYVTNVHSVQEYEQVARNSNWQLEDKVDLRPQTAAYWRLRERSMTQSGTESFMSKGFTSGAIEYYLLKFRRG